MARYLIRSQSPTPPRKLEKPTLETKKRPLAADYMDGPPTKEARIARLTTNTNFPVETFESRRQWKASQRLARALSPPQAPSKENPLPSYDATTIRTDTSDVFISARKSMTVRTYIHTIAKRAEMVALLDSGATENFLNLTYARWLKIPIKRLPSPRTLLNVDGTENRSGRLEYYTDLQVRTGNDITKLRFFLSDLGEHKAILGYPWFAAVQPKIDWRKGWIDHTQLPIILKTSDATKATFISKTRNVPCSTHQDQFYIGRVTIFPTNDVPFEPFGKPSQPPAPKIPPEYQRHSKVFSEEASQRLPGHTIWDHAIELLPGAPTTLPGRLLPLTQVEKEEAYKLVTEHLERGTIRPSWGPYAANLFFVKKKDGKLRPVQDYRPVNKWTKKNRNVSPLIPEVIDQLSGCTLFTKFDIRWGYNNICIKEGDEWKAAFLTHEGLFELTVMFFGLTNSPATFQMMMNTIFRQEVALGWLSVYMDDITIHTKRRPNETEEEHQARHREYVHLVCLPFSVLSWFS